MEKKHYDTWQFKQAQDTRGENPTEAIEKFEAYLKEYPNDYSAYGYYATNLIMVGRIDDAQKVINDLERTVKKDTRFVTREPYKMEAVVFSIFYNRLRIYSYKGEYQKLYDLCMNHPKEVKHMNLNDLMFYCKNKLGRIHIKRTSAGAYLFRQIVEYKEEDFLDHVQKHLADYNSTLDDPNKNIFSPDFPLNDVLKEIKKNMPSDKKLLSGFWENVYIFKYNECGRVNNKLVNYFKVVCFDGTGDIITMLPVDFGEELPHVDLSYMIEEKPVKETKRESAIERFNRRFKR